MAFSKKDYKAAIQEPLDKPPVMDQESQDRDITYFKEKIAGWLFNLGMDVEKGTGFEMSDGADNLRIYELAEDGKSWKNPFEDGTAYDSPEFLDKIRMGRIIAFPAGEKTPIQLQYKVNNIALSKPITEPFTPQPTEPQRPGLWARFANFITRGRAYQKEFDDYNKLKETYDQQSADWKAERDNFQELLDRRTPEVLDAEVKQFAEDQKRAEEKAAMEESRAFREKLELMEKDYSNCAIEQYMNTYDTIYSAKPPFLQSYADKFVYSSETFKKLKQYELPKGKDLPGTEVSDKEFTALSLFAAIDPAISGGLRSEEASSLTREQNVINSCSMFTETVIYDMTSPRSNTERYFDEVIQPARQKAMEAVSAYRDPKNPDPQKLGQLIAEGMHHYLHRWEPKPLSNTRDLATRSQTMRGVELLERDPKLMEAAMKAKDKDGKPLLTQQDLRVARGLKMAVDLNRRNQKASVMLEAERRGEITLTDEERRQYTKDRLAYETINRDMENDLSAQKSSEKYATAFTAASSRTEQLNNKWVKDVKAVSTAERDNKPKEEVQRLQEIANRTKAELGRATGDVMLFDAMNVDNPEALEALGAHGEKAIDGLIAKHLPGADKIYELKGQALEDALKPDNLFAEKSPYRQAAAPEKAPEPEIKTEKVEEKKQPEPGLNH